MSDFIMGLAAVIQKEIGMLSSVAQNAANANTAGYKSVQSFPAMVGVTGGSKSDDVLLGLGERQHVLVDDGALKYTGKSTDIALTGNAWFVLDTPDGERLTRDGRFRLSKDGLLVSHAGWPVRGMNGAVRLDTEVFTAERDGTLRVNGSDVGKLYLVSTESAADIQLADHGLYKTRSPLGLAANHVVHQGMLEQSNVNLSSDMVRLMETTRHIESVQRALTAYDSVLNAGISQIGKD